MSYFANVSKIARVPRPPATSGHAKRQASDHISARFPSLDFKNIFRFCRLLSPKIPRKHQSTPKKCLLLPCFAPFQAENSPWWCAGGLLSDAGVNECWLIYKAGVLYRELAKSDHPPPQLGSKKRLYPHNFSHQKYRKKSPWQD